jgi:hypothetical protein
VSLSLADLGPQAAVDLLHSGRERLVVGGQQLAGARERDAGVREGADPDELDHRCRVVAPIAGVVARGLGQQALRVVVPDRAHRHPGVRRELADGHHELILRW